MSQPQTSPIPASTLRIRSAWQVRAVVAALLAFALGACGGDNGNPADPDAGTDAVADAGDDATTDVGEDPSEDPIADAGEDVADTGAEDTGAEDTGADTLQDVGGEDAADDTFFDPDVPVDDDVDDPDPVGPLGILAVDPASGPDEGNTPVIVFGYGFTVDTQILINGRLAEDVDFVDAETILARTPANPAGIYDVKVSNPSEEAVLIQGFSYFADLDADRVEPSTGPERGGVPATLYGAGFTDDTLVSVGGRLGIDIRVLGPQRIEFIVPPGVAGEADVRVTNENGSEVLVGGFDYYAEPTIEAVVPAAGATAGGYVVELRGTGFTDDAIVSFGPSSAATTFIDAQTLEVVVPPGAAGATDVTVASAFGGDTVVGGFRYVADVDGALDPLGVEPASGAAVGGYPATVYGPGVQAATEVLFGTEAATIESATPGAVTVTVPAGSGLVDVTVTTADASEVLTDAFEYLPVLAVDAVAPAVGDVRGGDTVVVSGAGFEEGMHVRFGPIPAPSVVVDSADEMTVVTPPGTIGMVDVTVSDPTRAATLQDGFTFIEDAAVSSIVPSRGAIAGNTYVVIRGRGFYGDVSVFFGDFEAPVVEVVDAATLVVRTPAVPEPERVAVIVNVDGTEVRTGKNFVFYDPFSPAGGWWGDPIDGSVNVTVVEGGGSPIESAFVTLHIRVEDTAYTCVTNANGQCTISYPEIEGEQTISASAVDYSAVTINHVDAENVVISLSSTEPPSPGTPPPYTPPTIRGTLEGLDKIVDPGEGESIIGVIRTTTPGVGSSNPPGTGFAQVTWVSGDDPIPYEMFSREGDLAVVAHCGVYNEGTGEFTPLYMGVARGLAVRGEGSIYEVDLECDIHLSQTLTVKFRNPPLYAGGPEINQAIPYLDFGGEGAIDFLRAIEGRTEIISQDHFVPLDNPVFAGVEYEFIGQSVTLAGGLPYSVVFARDVLDPDDRVDFPASIPPADLLHPSPGGVAVERRFEWEVATDERPDFYYAYIQDTAQEITFWEVWLPGDETGFNLPYFPPGEGAGTLPSGPLVLIVLAVDAITFDYDEFEFNDFGRWNWRAYSAAGWLWINPAE